MTLEQENPDLLASPGTDAGTIPNLKFSFATARNRLAPGGWAREVTVRELPVATTLAGVNMRLKPGGIRELHWHKEAEWAYMLAGRARITAIDPQGRNFIDDVGEGDLWNFPAGIPHSIQGLEEGCEFLLVFDNGNFSENETSLISDWFAHTPREVLAKNFGVPEAAFANLRRILNIRGGSWQEMCPARSPWTRSNRRRAVPDVVQLPIARPGADQGGGRTGADRGFLQLPGGDHHRGGAGGGRAGRNAANCIGTPTRTSGSITSAATARMTVFASGGKARTFDYQAGDVGYVPFAMGHYVENTGDESLHYPGAVSQFLLRRRVVEPMDGLDHAEARAGPSQPGPADHGHPAQGQARHRWVTKCRPRRRVEHNSVFQEEQGQTLGRAGSTLTAN